MAEPRAVVVHGLADARAALAAAAETGAAVVIESAPGAGAFAGAAWFGEVVRLARAERPEVDASSVLDCGDQAGAALGAIRAGLPVIRFTGPAEVRARIAEIAAGSNVRLDDGGRPALDFAAQREPEAACRAWLKMP